MKTQHEPKSAKIDNQIIVHLQSVNRRAASRCQSYDSSAVIAPPEVLGPALMARVKQWDRAFSDRIGASNDVPFRTVAGPTSQTRLLEHRLHSVHDSIATVVLEP